MVRYSVSNDQRQKFYYVFAFISIALSSLFRLIPYEYINKITIPTGFAIYGILVMIFDKYLWKWRYMASLTKIPNLNGIWKGINTMTDGTNEDLKVTIIQTWSKIDIIVTTNETISNVTSASIGIENGKVITFKYTYTIKPKKRAGNVETTLTNNLYGEGFTTLWYAPNENPDHITGTYVSSKYRGGDFKLDRSNHELK